MRLRRPTIRAAGRAAAIASAMLMVALVGTIDVAASCGDVNHATITGSWQMRATVTAQGAESGAAFPTGHVAVDSVHFVTTCVDGSKCALAVELPGQPGSQFYSNSSGVYAPPADHPMTQEGATYSAAYPAGGYGGLNVPPCPAPPLIYTMTLRVAQAEPDISGSGSHATVVVGEELEPGLWTCNGHVGIPGARRHIELLAVPAGNPFPAQITPTCDAARNVSLGANAAQIPSTIASSLPTPSEVASSIPALIAGALLTLGIMLFITFPSQLFNKTLEENYAEIRALVRRRGGGRFRARRRLRRGSLRSRRNAAFVTVIVVGAILGGLNDPNFGFNRTSAASYIAVILSIVFGMCVAAATAVVYRTARHRNRHAVPHALPAGLAIAAACVLVSRLTNFTPGYLYGVVCGLAFPVKLAVNEDAHNVVLKTVATLIIGISAWLLWIPVTAAAVKPQAGFGLVVFDDFLASVFVGGLVGTVITLFPLRFLPGGALAQWNRVAWAVTFGLALFGLIVVMLNPASAQTHKGSAPLFTAILLFVGFGGSSVAFRWYFRALRRGRLAAKRARSGR